MDGRDLRPDPRLDLRPDRRPRAAERPTHPRWRAALLMVGVVVLLVALSLAPLLR